MKQYPNKEVYFIERLQIEENREGFSLYYLPAHSKERVLIKLFSKENIVSQLMEWLDEPYII